MHIETKRMLIRNFVPEDAAALYEILGDEETMESCEPAYNLEKTEKFLENFCVGRKGAVVAYAFSERRAHKIFAETIDPVKSVSLMKKLGMRLEGIQRSQTKDNHGNWADMHIYGMLDTDYRAKREVRA